MIKTYIQAFGDLFKDKDDFLFIALPLVILAGVISVIAGSILLSGISLFAALLFPMSVLWKVF